MASTVLGIYSVDGKLLQAVKTFYEKSTAVDIVNGMKY